ncbi:MAG: DUF58 domain-containing protein, partial [Haloarculaceae archaeon]
AGAASGRGTNGESAGAASGRGTNGGPRASGAGSAAAGRSGATSGEPATADLDPWAARVLARLPPTAQVVVFTPLLDEWGVTLSRALTARGYPTILASPDVTGATLGGEVAAIERGQRLGRVELAGASVIDWKRTEPIDTALRASLVELFDS